MKYRLHSEAELPFVVVRPVVVRRIAYNQSHITAVFASTNHE